MEFRTVSVVIADLQRMLRMLLYFLHSWVMIFQVSIPSDSSIACGKTYGEMVMKY